VQRLLDAVEGAHGIYRMMAGTMYGAELRLMECCRLRAKDFDFQRGQLIIREAKGNKDRAVPSPEKLRAARARQLAW
jgi:integrase